STRQQVLGLRFSIGTLNEDFSLAAADPTKMNDSVNLCDNRGFVMLTRFKELDDTEETTRTVFGLRGLSRNRDKLVTGVHLITSLSHQMSLRRNEVGLDDFSFLILYLDLRLSLLIGRVSDYLASQAGDFVDLLPHGDSFHNILEDNCAPYFRQDGEGKGIPFEELLPRLDRLTVFDHQSGAVNN